MPCPSCGNFIVVEERDRFRMYNATCNNYTCRYQAPMCNSKAEAIATHNRVYNAMKNAKVHEQVKIELLNIANNGSKTTVAEIVKRYYTAEASKESEVKMTNKIYTAQEVRDTAQCLHYNSPTRLTIEAATMLRQAADTQERCDKAVESMHTQLMHLANDSKTTVDVGRLSKYFAHLENILRGDAWEEEK